MSMDSRKLLRLTSIFALAVGLIGSSRFYQATTHHDPPPTSIVFEHHPNIAKFSMASRQIRIVADGVTAPGPEHHTSPNFSSRDSIASLVILSHHEPRITESLRPLELKTAAATPAPVPGMSPGK